MELKVIPILQVLISSLLMVTLAYFLPELSYSWQFSQSLSIFILITSIVIALLAVYCFKQAKTTVNPTKPENSSTIVDTGIYRFSRNPMYVSFLLIVCAIAIFLQNKAAYIVIPIFIIYITRYQIIPEERILVNLFGNNYKVYCGKVRRWV
jgi:protein-S-isoprenylcysteine O-methyltransferase Ste14